MVVPRAADSEASSLELKPNGGVVPLVKGELQPLGGAPLTPLPLRNFVAEVNITNVFRHKDLPFDLSKHPRAGTHVSNAMLERLGTDVNSYSEALSQKVELHLKTVSDLTGRSITSAKCASAKSATSSLRGAVVKLHAADVDFVKQGIVKVVNLANGAKDHLEDLSQDLLAHQLGVLGGTEPSVDFQLLVALVMSKQASQTLQQFNPNLSVEEAHEVLQVTAVLMLRVNRMSQSMRCLSGIDKLLRNLGKIEADIKAGTINDEAQRVRQHELTVQANHLAELLGARRHYVKVTLKSLLSICRTSNVCIPLALRLLSAGGWGRTQFRSSLSGF